MKTVDDFQFLRILQEITQRTDMRKKKRVQKISYYTFLNERKETQHVMKRNFKKKSPLFSSSTSKNKSKQLYAIGKNKKQGKQQIFFFPSLHEYKTKTKKG